MKKRTISWANPHFWGNEERYVIDALRSNWISGGEYVDRLEAEFARFCGSPFAVAVSNGTTALHVAFLALGIGPGDEVIVPGFGFMAAANVALHVGAKPIFSEVNADTWCMTAEDVERCLSVRTKAIIPIHTYGNVCDMDPIMELAARKKVAVIEDAAEAIGSRYRGKVAGTIGTVGIYSFQATKTITTGEGGAVVTGDSELRDRMRLFRSHGMLRRRYWHDVAGHNFRLTNMQAAMGCAQLERIGEIAAARSRVYQVYKRALQGIEGVFVQHYAADVNPIVWAIAVRLNPSVFRCGRDGVIERLNEMGIETRPGFYAATTMPHLYGEVDLTICSELGEQVLSLPSSPMLTDDEIQYVCGSLRACGR